MPPTPSLADIRYIVDEDSRGFGMWLSRLRKDMTCVGSEPVDELLPLGTPDPTWIPLVAERGWIAITKNSKIRTQPREAKLAVEHGLRIACLMEPVKGANRWDFAQMVMRHWDAIVALEDREEATWLSVFRDRVKERPFQPGQPERAQTGRL
jgi:hypothetical protein